MRFCKLVLGVLTYVACDGSLLKRLTLFKLSFQRTVLSVIRRDRKKKRARDYFMTAFLCGENRSCDKSRLLFQPEIIQIIARVYFYNDISCLDGQITLKDMQSVCDNFLIARGNKFDVLLLRVSTLAYAFSTRLCNRRCCDVFCSVCIHFVLITLKLYVVQSCNLKIDKTVIENETIEDICRIII